MVEFYVSLIRQGKIIIDNVPELWREEVRAALTDAESIENPALQKAAAWDELTGVKFNDSN